MALKSPTVHIVFKLIVIKFDGFEVVCNTCDHQMYISCFSLRSTCTKSASSFLWVSYLLRSPSHQRIFPALHRIKLNVPISCIKRTRLHCCSCGNEDPSFSFFDKPVGYTSCRVNYLLKICYIKTLWVDRNTLASHPCFLLKFFTFPSSSITSRAFSCLSTTVGVVVLE